MKRLVTLFAIPNSTTLVDWILADEAILFARSQRLDKEDALLRKVLKLIQEILVIVLQFRLVLIFILSLNGLNFFSSSYFFLVISKIFTGTSEKFL